MGHRDEKADDRSHPARATLAICAAALALFLLLPASASAAINSHITIAGSGDGEVINPADPFYAEWISKPPIECKYVAPGPQTGVCDTEAQQPTPEVPIYAIAVEALPALGSKFVEWTIEQGASVAGSCEPLTYPLCSLVLSKGEIKLKATFEAEDEPAFHSLAVTKIGAGTGTVVSSPSGIDCGSICLSEYKEGTEVTLTATPSEGHEFTGWEGCDEEPEGKCKVAMSEAREVKAGFEEEEAPPAGPPLTLKIESGEGAVVSDPAGLECSGAAPESCATEAIEAGTVTLTASPAPGYQFVAWKKCDSGGVNGRQCTIELNEAREVGAVFIPVWALTIDKAEGSGPGIAKTKPGGIVCGYNCTTGTASFKEGKEVEILTKPAKHFEFVEFAGGTGQAAGCSETCKYLPEGENSSVEALFEEEAKNTLSLAKEGGGQGFVKTKPAGVICGYTCSEAEAEFYAADTIVLSIKLNKGTSSLDWVSGAGTCTGTIETAEASCEVTMGEAHALVAKFE